MPQQAQQQAFKFVKSPKAKRGINLRDPTEEFATTDQRQSLSELSNTRTQYPWWLALVYV